ncbi:hypothetical protein F4808DRAFT_133371 [Astrocystis sublimbata]|nr:hypothetical protein F4808DRAFT_133371 [Astrocystis sublimbata]
MDARWQINSSCPFKIRSRHVSISISAAQCTSHQPHVTLPGFLFQDIRYQPCLIISFPQVLNNMGILRFRSFQGCLVMLTPTRVSVPGTGLFPQASISIERDALMCPPRVEHVTTFRCRSPRPKTTDPSRGQLLEVSLHCLVAALETETDDYVLSSNYYFRDRPLQLVLLPANTADVVTLHILKLREKRVWPGWRSPLTHISSGQMLRQLSPVSG